MLQVIVPSILDMDAISFLISTEGGPNRLACLNFAASEDSRQREESSHLLPIFSLSQHWSSARPG